MVIYIYIYWLYTCISCQWKLPGVLPYLPAGSLFCKIPDSQVKQTRLALQARLSFAPSMPQDKVSAGMRAQIVIFTSQVPSKRGDEIQPNSSGRSGKSMIMAQLNNTITPHLQ